MFNTRSSYPITLYGGKSSRSRLGANWKMFNTDTDKYIKKNNAPSNRPPAHNNSPGEKNNELNISGSNANNFRARPLKHWRKQNTPNYELIGDNNNIYNQKNRSNTSLLHQIDRPGGITSTRLTDPKCELSNSTTLIPDLNKEQENKVGKYNKLNKDCSGKAPVCDPPTKAKNRVLYPSSVNNNPNKINYTTYYQTNSSYLQSRCKSYSGSFIKKSDGTVTYGGSNKITILDCSNNEIPNNKIPDKKCSTKFYKTSNPQFSQNTSVKSSTGLLRKKYNTLRSGKLNNGQGLSNFDNQIGSSMCSGSRREVPFLLKTSSQYSAVGAKINPVKCEPGLYRKPGNFTTSCMNNRYGKTIMHMQLDIKTKNNIDKNIPGYYSTNRQQKLTKSKHIPKQLTIGELAAIHNTSRYVIKNLT